MMCPRKGTDLERSRIQNIIVLRIKSQIAVIQHTA